MLSKLYFRCTDEYGALSVTVIVVENEIDDPNSNPG